VSTPLILQYTPQITQPTPRARPDTSTGSGGVDVKSVVVGVAMGAAAMALWNRFSQR